jgi:putative N6-adenine-specific DNA methylase
MTRTTTDTPLNKRIKRHVIGRKRQFFAATAPGLETICREELKALLPSGTPMAIVEGGVEFTARLHDCYLADLNLRTANRLLMRIASFHAANFRKFEKNLTAVPWELFLLPGTPTHIRVTSRHSRLFHKDAVAGRVQASIAFRFAQNEFSGDPPRSRPSPSRFLSGCPITELPCPLTAAAICFTSGASNPAQPGHLFERPSPRLP